MAKQYISEGLTSFLKERIQTVLRLEVLLLLHQHQPQAMTARDVASHLGFDHDTTTLELTELAAIGVIAQSSGDAAEYRYQPQDAELGIMVEQLATGYSNQRIPIFTAILAEHSDRARRFTEAYRIISTND